MKEHLKGVLIVGAGVAGLAAGRILAERGVRVLVLEARQRVGGRLHTQVTAEGDVIELGAEFVHGRPAELWSLIKEAGLETTERDGSRLRYAADGRGLHEDEKIAGADPFAILSELADLADDLPFAEWLAASDVPVAHRAALTGYVEGFNAADARRISARSLGIQQRAEEATEGDRLWHLRGGYALLAEYLADRVRELGGEIRLQSEAVAIFWQAGRVEVEVRGGERLIAPKCIIALPLGVLQRESCQGGIRFEPEPAGLGQARRLAMGHVVRFTLVFRDAWWRALPNRGVALDALRRLSFLFTAGERIPVWWTAHPDAEARATLTGWAGGTQAGALAGLGKEALGQQAIRSLAHVFGVSEEQVGAELVSVHFHDWSTDPFAHGAYSYVPAGTLDATAAMGRPEAATLFFAGEHTDAAGNWGTVHAALHSGLRAAAQVLDEA